MPAEDNKIMPVSCILSKQSNGISINEGGRGTGFTVPLYNRKERRGLFYGA